MEEIFERFDLPFQTYLQKTLKHYFLDTKTLRCTLESDHSIIFNLGA
jgi:hypothetical protein